MPKLIIKSLKANLFRLPLAFTIAFALPFNAKADGDNLPEYAHGTPIPEAQFCPTAPDVQAMIRYGNESYVNMYTGAASYAINLYTYKDRDFTIPISISYNGDGFMPGRNPGCVGTGWFLNVGGVITREARGLPDESTSHTYAAKTKGDGSVDNVFALASASGLGHGVLKQMLRDYNRMTSVDVYGFGARNVSSGQMKPVDYAYSGEIGREYVLFQEEVTSSSSRNFETESDLYHFFAPHNDFNLATLMTDNVVQDSSETILGRTFIKRLEPQESFKYIVVCREKNDDFSKYIVVEKASFVSKIIGFNVPEVFLYGKSELVVL